MSLLRTAELEEKRQTAKAHEETTPVAVKLTGSPPFDVEKDSHQGATELEAPGL